MRFKEILNKSQCRVHDKDLFARHNEISEIQKEIEDEEAGECANGGNLPAKERRRNFK